MLFDKYPTKTYMQVRSVPRNVLALTIGTATKA
jgi:hypothetical protein